MNSLVQRMDGASKFLKSTWTNQSEVRYRVYMAQKCLNLNEHYFIQELHSERCSTEEKKLLTTVRNQTFISQYALLLKADELVEYYAMHQAFPCICVIDELILTGHDFCSLMYRMLDVIFEAWQYRYGEIEPEEYWNIRNAFIRSVTYKAYGRGNEAVLLDPSLPSIGDPLMLEKSEWYQYTADVVELLNESEKVQNTSFIPTFWLSDAQYADIFHYSNEYLHGCNNRHWIYDDIEADIWQKSIIGVQSDVRFHIAFVCRKPKYEGTQCITPYVFWGKLPNSSLDGLFKDIAAVLRQRQSNQLNILAEICEVPYSVATNSKLRFLYSLICLLELLELTKLPLDTVKHDLEKTAQNFGTIDEIYPALQVLCMEDSKVVRKQLRDIIYQAMLGALDIDQDAGNSDIDDEYNQHDCLKNAEDYFISVDHIERQRTKLRRDENLAFGPSSNFFYAGGCLSRYFQRFNGNYAFEEKVAALTLLAQGNVISFTISSQEDDFIYAKVGEATAIAARYGDYSLLGMADYIPALIILEKVCQKFDLATEYWAAQFGEFLEKKGAPKGLGKRFGVFVDCAYRSGTLMSDYRFVKRRESGTGNEDNDLQHCQQVYYQEQVAVFFREG